MIALIKAIYTERISTVDTREFIGTKQLTFADASYSEEYNYSVLHEDAFSPVGNLVLIHYPQHNLPHNTVDSSVDEDYCTVVLVNQKYGQLTESMANYKFKTYGKLFGNNKIIWSRDTITVMCHAGRLVFNLTSGESEFVAEGIQNVNLHFKNWRREYQSQGQLYTIKGLSWCVPSRGRAQPMRTFVFEDDVQDEYDHLMTKLNKSIPAGNISLNWTMLFENDSIAVFKVGHRTVVGFDKLLKYQPVVYQLSKTTDYYDIVAVTKDRIYSSTFIDDDGEYGSFGGQIIVRSYQFDFAAQIERFICMDKLPNMPAGGALTIIAKFLVQQKKN